METLTKEEREAIVELRNSKGYGVLLRLFEKELDIIQDVLLHTTDPEQELHLVSRWREFKRIYSTLKNAPEYLAEEMASASMDVMDESYSAKFDSEILNTYRKKMYEEALKPAPAPPGVVH